LYFPEEMTLQKSDVDRLGYFEESFSSEVTALH